MAQEITQETMPEIELIVKALVEHCDNNHYINPRIEIDMVKDDGRKFKLIFERTDLDEF